jgi:hypothetical protein
MREIIAVADGNAGEIMLASFAGFVFVLLWYTVTMSRFLTRLRQFENDTWIRLGSPTVGNRYNGASGNVLIFLMKKQYLGLSDLVAVDLGGHLRFIQHIIFGYVGFAVIIVGSIILFIKP